jgi:hypothetical protein
VVGIRHGFEHHNLAIERMNILVILGHPRPGSFNYAMVDTVCNITRLKLNHLVPVMSESLGLDSFSIINRRGFGCSSCHFSPNGPMFEH